MKKILIAALAVMAILFSCKKNVDIISNSGGGPGPQEKYDSVIAFGSLHPCGIAVSRLGKVAVSTYEGDGQLGAVKIWFSFTDFVTNKPANSTFSMIDPEAVTFDNAEVLYISCTTGASSTTGVGDGDNIYYIKDVTAKPNVSPLTAVNNSWLHANPRGLTVDANNELIAAYEGDFPGFNSAVYIFPNPTSATGTIVPMIPSSKLNGALTLGVAYGHSSSSEEIWTSNYQTQDVKEFNYGNASVSNNVPLPGKGIDIALTYDGIASTADSVYCTTVENGQSHLRMGSIDGFAPFKDVATICPVTDINDVTYIAWGVAVYQRYVIVADAPANAVMVLLK